MRRKVVAACHLFQKRIDVFLQSLPARVRRCGGLDNNFAWPGCDISNGPVGIVNQERAKRLPFKGLFRCSIVLWNLFGKAATQGLDPFRFGWRRCSCHAFLSPEPRNRPAAYIVTAANLRKRLRAMIAALDRLASLVIGEFRLAAKTGAVRHGAGAGSQFTAQFVQILSARMSWISMPSRKPRSAIRTRSAGNARRIASKIAQPARTRSARPCPIQPLAARSS